MVISHVTEESFGYKLYQIRWLVHLTEDIMLPMLHSWLSTTLCLILPYQTNYVMMYPGLCNYRCHEPVPIVILQILSMIFNEYHYGTVICYHEYVVIDIRYGYL